MKHILFLFTASLLLLACSNDDENPQPEEQTNDLKIQKFSRTVYDPNGEIYRIDQLFDESGKVTNRVEDYFNDNTTFNDTYSYNTLNQVSAIQLRKVQDNSPRRTINYIYDESSNKLQNIQWVDLNGDVANTIIFIYDGNTVMTENDFGFRNLTFDAIGKLTNTISGGGDIVYETVTETISHSENLITSLHYESSLGSTENYVFEYDNKVNPVFESFNANINNYIYGFVGNMKNFTYNFSENNYTRIEYTNTSDPSYNYTQIKTTQYNEDGYPISAVVKKDDVVIEELTYEYY